MRLIEAVLGLDQIERERIASIRLECHDGLAGRAHFNLAMNLPGSESFGELFGDIEVHSLWRAPDLVREIEWRVKAWDQCMLLIDDVELAQPGQLGSMQLAEYSGGKLLIITTHGAPRSAERLEWLRRISK